MKVLNSGFKREKIGLNCGPHNYEPCGGMNSNKSFGSPCGNYFRCIPRGPGIGTSSKFNKNKN